jgi:formate hydrogenlyase transcriptional activator
MDSSYHFTAANAAYQKMVGYSFEELRSMTCMDLVCDADHSTYQALNSELSSGKGDRFEMETRQRRKDGDLVWMRVNGSVLQARSGEPMVLVAMIEDISERKRLHDDLERERNVLRHLVEITQRFIAKVDVLDVIDAVLAGLDDQGCFWKWASLYLPEPSTDRLRVYLNRGIRECLREGHTIPIEGTIAGRVYRSGQPLLFRGDELAAASTEYNGCPSLQEAVRARLLETGCALPLIEDGRVLGVLFLGTSAKRDVSAVEFDYWQQLAGFVAAAISKARRFSEMTSSHEKLVTAKGYIEEQIRASFDLLHIVGRSKALQDVLEQVSMVAPTDSAVLILGETGTGKELIARAIHDRGERRDQAFIKVDCSAIPATLLESELFGHEKGAFTGAVANRLGRFEVADKGTLFLDEVGDLPLELQAKLLRFLQERTIERLGSNRTLSLDVRIVAATNRNLDDMVATGAFRADLYYRLKVFPITIPALRERPEDIEPLVWHYVRKYAGRLKKKIDSIPACAMDIFKQYPWPGNVRELQHFMERSAILTSGNVLQAPLQELRQVIRHPPVTFSSAGRTMEDIERDSILQALRESNWVVGGPHGAARRLGLKRTTLASRMERLGVSRPR